MKKMPIFSVVVLSLLITAFLGVGSFTLYRNWLFSGEVIRVAGIIDQLHESTRKGNHTYRVNYHYSDRNEGPHSGECQLPREAWRKLHKGDAVTIRYLPGSPDVSRLDVPAQDERESRQGWISLSIGSVLLAILVASEWWARRRQTF